MSHFAPPTDARPLGLAGFWPVVVTNTFLGLPAYFISFLSYGFRDEVGVTEHMTFLVLIAVFASVSGLIGAAFPTGEQPGPTLGSRVASGVPMSLALNAAVVAGGSIVSALHKDENSVSADFSTTTDVLVATSLFVLAGVLAVAAVRVQSAA